MNPNTQGQGINDRTKFRQEYLNTLHREANNIQKNYNANVVFKKTGESPAVNTDDRTITEKLQDLESVKGELRGWLLKSGILRGSQANAFVQSADEDQLEWCLTHKDFIERDFKARDVPAQVFSSYIYALIVRELETEGVNYGLQESTGREILGTAYSIYQKPADLPDNDDLSDLNNGLSQMLIQFPQLSRNIQETLRRVGVLQEQIDEMDSMSYADRNAFLNHSISKDELRGELEQLFLAQHANDENRCAVILEKLDEMLSKPETQSGETQTEEQEDKVGGGGEPKKPRKPRNPREPPSPIPEMPVRELTPTEFYNASLAEKRAFLQEKQRKGEIDASYHLNRTGEAKLNKIYNTWFHATNEKEFNERNPSRPPTGRTDMESEQSGYGLKSRKRMSGRGINMKKMDKVFEPEPKPYTQLGNLLIDKRKLGNNILYLKKPYQDHAHREIPSQKISNKMTDIVKNLMIKRQPEYGDLEGLGFDEKHLLRKIVNHSKLDISVPNPNKNQEEKENDRFDILKGEIIAGNDNTKIAKELKLMIVKFLHLGKIPKREAHEILLELASMGI